jgi:hypothetical protein
MSFFFGIENSSPQNGCEDLKFEAFFRTYFTNNQVLAITKQCDLRRAGKPMRCEFD